MEKQDSRILSRLDNDYSILMSSLKVSVSKHKMDEYLTVVWANDYFYERTLYTREEYEAIYHNHCSTYFQQDMVEFEKFAKAIQTAIDAGDPSYTAVCKMPQKGGSYIWIKIVGTFTDEKIDGYPVIYSTFTDISDVMQMQIDQSVTYDNMPGFVAKYLVEKHGFQFLEANQKFLDYLELNKTELRGFQAFSTLTPESIKAVEEHHEAMRRGEPVHFVVDSRDQMGRETWFQMNGECVGWIQEDPIFLMVYIDITDVTEQRELRRQLEERTKQLGAALDSAERANDAKTDFLARMSHDLRTPINAIVGMTAIAGAHIREQERVLDCLQKISVSSQLLLSLINEVLDMSKIGSGRLTLSEDEFCLGKTVQDLVTMMQPELQKKEHNFNVHVVGVRHEDVIGDSQRLEQILMNILSNAVKYTPDKGRITLEVREKEAVEGKAVFEFIFEDNGCGMKPEFLDKLFQPFERADDQEIRSIQGTGLGMAISQSIARKMGGDIEVRSEYGKGSRFTVRIPLRLQEGARYEQAELGGLSVLLVDDDEIVRDSVGECLDSFGMEAYRAGTGEQSVDMVKKRHEQGDDFFAVIMDFRLPGINGIQAARKIRSEVGDSVPILLLSAYNTEVYETEARRAGINGFITKPLFPSKLYTVLKRILYRKDEPLELAPPPLSGDVDCFGRRILLAEDNDLNREIAVEIIGSTGAEVDSAVNGAEAVNMVSCSPEGTYDMIFMDIQMPVMDGYEAARMIRGLDRMDTKTVPMIALTANAFAEDVQNALNAGMNNHLPKPIEIPRLMNLLKSYLVPVSK